MFVLFGNLFTSEKVANLISSVSSLAFFILLLSKVLNCLFHVIVSGKLRAQHAKSMKFKDGT